MTVSRRRPSLRLSVLCLAVTTLALVFMSRDSAATPDLDHSSGPTSTQAEQPTQQPTSQAGAPDTGGQTPTIPTPFPKATKQPEVTTRVTPPGHSSIPFIQVSAGFHHTCGLWADGNIVCWGASGEAERLTESTGLIDSPPGSFSQISAGYLHSCALRLDGAVECWGGTHIDDVPPEAKAMMEAMSAPPEGRFISVSAGFQFSCGVRIDNSAECWGLKAAISDALTPPVGKYTSVSAGGYHACGIRIDQTVVCWGSNLGLDGEFLGQAMPPDGPFKVINAGTFHTCGFRPDGEIRCWGSIVGGEVQTCEQQPDGTARCWMNERATEANRAWGGWPDYVPDGNRKAMDSGDTFACALWYDGSIGCWGSGGINDPPPPGPFRAVTVGREHGCGLRPDGSIECWGDDSFGQASTP